MTKRILTTFVVAVVLGLAVPFAASAMPTDHSGGPVVVARTSTPVNVPVQSQPSGFQWGDFGIGVGVTLGSLLLVGVAATEVRRHHGQLAH
jgi:hypothetical protein